MALDPKFVIDGPLWELFTDKDTGLPLRDGYILFFKDDNRAQFKEVFQLVGSGSPPNPPYTYASYGFLDGNNHWRLDLNDQGAIDFAMYFYPYDTNGDVELYFVQVYSVDDVLQFTREAWPNTIAAGDTLTDIQQNFVPNPQFLLHYTIPATTTNVAGQITQLQTEIAYGGWRFSRTNNNGTDIVTFPRFASYQTPPPDGNPRYGCRIQCTSVGASQLIKYLALRFSDVNKFNNGQTYTFAFNAIVNSGGTTPVSLLLIKNFGTGGSTATTTTLATFSITTSYQAIPYVDSFTFGNNTGKTIGVLDDDYETLVLAYPTDSTFDITVTNFILTPGIVAAPAFPEVPDTIYLAQSLFVAPGGNELFSNSVPAYDGSDLFLPATLGHTGIFYDESDVGSLILTTEETAPDKYLECTGQITYDSTTTSAVGIPFSRLATALFNSTLNCPMFGTGPDFVTVGITQGSSMRFETNASGGVTATADGAVATGFTFKTIHTGGTYFNVNGHYANNNKLFILNSIAGATAILDENTSGFTVETIDNSPTQLEFSSVTTIVPATLAGKYFSFDSTSTALYVWFTVDGAGADPVPPGKTGLRVDLYTSAPAMTANDVASVIPAAISQRQNSFVNTVAATSIAASSYFLFSTLSANYYVWYTKDNVGTDPAIGGKIGINVSIVSADTAAQVATKTQIAINSRYFATPDLRGKFLRIWANDQTTIDLDAASRWSSNSVIVGNVLGTEEWYRVQAHHHEVLIHPFGVDLAEGLAQNSADQNTNTTTENTGGTETRPVNQAVNAFIRY